MQLETTASDLVTCTRRVFVLFRVFLLAPSDFFRSDKPGFDLTKLIKGRKNSLPAGDQL